MAWAGRAVGTAGWGLVCGYRTVCLSGPVQVLVLR